MKVVRAFVGFFTSKQIHEVSERIRQEVEFKLLGKWVEPQNLHMTFQFLGDITESQAIDVIRNLQEVAKRNIPFRIRYKSLGVFPDMRNPRVLWIGVSEGANKLVKLAKDVERLNAKKGIIPRNSKGFVPHVTICRIKKSDKKTLSHLLKKYKTVEFGQDEVNKIALISSSLTSVGPVYTVVEEFYLGA
ncbi:MAG: RNA 2',3'-cyclic phosphodiesterase [Aquificae bacterium]|nr:RNA 2',3'-cyclic phosphodiesterase [Aquificota bacterium]